MSERTILPRDVPDVQATVKRLCQLVGHVNEKAYDHAIPTDCFCGDGGYWPLRHASDWKFDPRVLSFIEEAVADRIRILEGLRKKKDSYLFDSGAH